jgi:hypothetical protein
MTQENEETQRDVLAEGASIMDPCSTAGEPEVCYLGHIFFGIIQVSAIVPVSGSVALAVDDNFARPCSTAPFKDISA